MRWLFVLMCLAAFNMQPDPDDIFADGIQWMPYIQPEWNNTQVNESPPSPCGEYRFIYDDAYFLCDPETGDLIMVDLPFDDPDSLIAFTSPDNEHMVFFYPSGRSFDVYGYDFDTLIPLGTLENFSPVNLYIDLCAWVNDTQGVICTQHGRSYMPDLDHRFDLTQENSIEVLHRNWFQRNTFIAEEVPRYVGMDSYLLDRFMKHEFDLDPDAPPCILISYDGEQHIQQVVGDHCDLIQVDDYEMSPFYRMGDVVYFTAYNDGDQFSTFYRFDAGTPVFEPPTVLMETSFHLRSISPDEHHFVSGGVGTQGFASELQIYRLYEPMNFGVIYTSEPMIVSSNRNIIWLDNQTVLIFADTVQASVRRITFTEDGYEVMIHTLPSGTILPPAARISPDGHYWLNEYSVFDLESFEPLPPILQDGITEAYEVTMRWLDNGNLFIRVDDDAYEVTLP